MRIFFVEILDGIPKGVRDIAFDLIKEVLPILFQEVHDITNNWLSILMDLWEVVVFSGLRINDIGIM